MTSLWVELRSLLALAIMAVISHPAVAAPESRPSLELLEFLGEWETPEGEWLDPLQLLEFDAADLEKKQAREHENE